MNTDDGRHPPDPHELRDSHDAAVLAALGESLGDADMAHLAACPDCQSEITKYRQVVRAVREVVAVPDPSEYEPPPGRVWDAIAAATAADSAGPRGAATKQLGASQTAADESSIARSTSRLGDPLRPDSVRRDLVPRQRVLALAAAVVLLTVGGVGGWALGRHTSRPAVDRLLAARLAAFPGAPAGVTGTASITSSSEGPDLEINASGLPATSGYYEVWLYDPTSGVMVPVGTLGRGGAGTFTVPAGMDLARYHVVDVSAQQLDTDPRHDRSMLRGTLG